MMLPNVVSDEKLKKSRPGVSDTMDGDEGSDKETYQQQKMGEMYEQQAYRVDIFYDASR